MSFCRRIFLATLALFLGGCANHSATPSAAATAPTATSPVSVSAGVIAGRLQEVKPPVYPPDAKAEKKEGTVILRAIIGKDGTIKNLRVISGPDMFRDAAVQAVHQWKYKPYLLMGVPVEVDTTITVNFRLHS